MGFEERRHENGQGFDGVLVKPGEIVLVDDGSRLMTVASAGIVVCLWHRGGSHAAMVHFLEPVISSSHKATARYGNVALPYAIRLLVDALGDPLAVLEAQIFGGAWRDGHEERAQANLQVARKVLAQRHIAIVSEDVAGSKGRKVVFDSATGHAMVIKVHSLREGDWNL